MLFEIHAQKLLKGEKVKSFISSLFKLHKIFAKILSISLNPTYKFLIKVI